VFLLHVPGELEFVKVLDFGISKVKAAGVKLTKAAVALGTPNYMSPEQAAGRTDEIDHPVDQWALACITWEMLCGHTPFVADEITALFYQVMNLQPQSLLLRVPGLAPEAELVLLRALSKSPKDRFPSIREFAHAFETAALGRPGDLTPLPISLSRPLSLGGNVAAKPELASTIEAEKRERTPRQLTTFSRTAGEMTDEIPRKRWWRLGLKPVHALVVLAGTLVLIGAIFLLRPRSPVAVPVAAPTRPSVITLPALSPPPEPAPAPQAEATSRPTDPPARSASGKSRSRKPQRGDAGDPLETRAPADKRRKVREFAPQPDLFHRNDTDKPAIPLQPKAKRTIIKEL
jgi:serine/threonine-protein kinase